MIRIAQTMKVTGIPALAMVAATCMAGCAGLLDSDDPAERIYWLEPYVVPKPDVATTTQGSLSVSVGAAPGLDTDKLLILEPGSRLNHYASARWPDNIPDVIQSHLQTTLESSGQFSRVTAGPNSQIAHRHLELEVREIYTVADDAGQVQAVRMTLGGYVNCSDTYDAIALSVIVGIDNDRLSNIVAAYQLALNEFSRQLVIQLVESCAEKHSPREGGQPRSSRNPDVNRADREQ